MMEKREIHTNYVVLNGGGERESSYRAWVELVYSRTVPSRCKFQSSQPMNTEQLENLAVDDGMWHQRATHIGTKSTKPALKSKNEIQILLFWAIVLITRYHTLTVCERIFLGIICFCDRCKLKHCGQCQLSLSLKYRFLNTATSFSF